MRTGIIYIIKNKVNDKVYVGQTTSPVEERWKAHIRRSRDTSKAYKIYNAIRAHGADKFFYEVLEEHVPLDLLDSREVHYIRELDSFHKGYNSTPGGDGSYLADLDEVVIIAKYKAGLTATQLSEEYDVSIKTVLRVLHKHQVAIRTKSADIDHAEFTENYNAGMSIADLSRKYGVDAKTISRLRNKLGLEKRLTKDRPSIPKQYNVNQFTKDVGSGMKMIDLAKKYEVDVKTVRKRIKTLNIIR